MKLAQLLSKGLIAITALLLMIMALSTPAESGNPSRNKHNNRHHPNDHDFSPNLQRSGFKTFVVDVAIDGRTFSPVGVENVAAEGEDPVFQPVRGTTFIVDGMILPGHSLPKGNEVAIDDYSDEAIGSWLCRGHFIHSLAAILSEDASPHVATTQQFYFGEDGIVGGDELIAEGNEGGVTTHRVVTGGTGEYKGMIGEVIQEPLGSNDTGLGNYRFTFRVKKRK